MYVDVGIATRSAQLMGCRHRGSAGKAHGVHYYVIGGHTWRCMTFDSTID